jgi:signal transduction histidine kinase
MGGSPEHDALYAAYRRELDTHRTVPYVRTGALVTSVINVAFTWLDHYAFPERFGEFLVSRALLQLVLLAVYLRAAHTRPRAAKWALCVGTGAMLVAVVYGTGAPATTDYYVGLMLFLMGVPMLLPMSGAEAALLAGLVVGAFGLAPALTPGAFAWKVYVVHAIFLASAGVVSLASSILLDRIRFRDFARQREVEQARDQLAELDRTKSRFTANVHHELRTPLTLTLAPIEGMLAGEFGELSELQRGYLKTMHVNALRLLKLINNLLDFAKLESRQLELRRRPLDPGRLAADLVAGARPLAERKRIALVGIGLEGLPRLHADPDALEKILTNLLGNALKFTDPGGRIELRAEAEGDGVHLTVADTGIGLPADQLERIFDRFAQVDTSATRRHEGTGIGLSLCKELVELHGGRIWAESPGPGQGTLVHVLLPAGVADAPAEEAILAAEDGRVLSARQSFEAFGAELDLEPALGGAGRTVELARTVERFESQESQAAEPADAAPAAALPESAPEILVSEDNADMRRLLAFLLGREYRVRLARNGREALEAVRARPPDLVLTDVMMPEMSGIELCRTLKADPATRGIPVVLVTSKAEREMKLEGLELGADDYVSKPFHPRELLARVRSLVRLRGLQAELAERNRALERANAGLTEALGRLREAQAQLVHREKMASVGQLVAGIAHEINNPVNFIQGNLHYLAEYVRVLVDLLGRYEAAAPELGERFAQLRDESELAHVLQDLDSVLAGCREGVERTTSLVRDLRTFSRLDRAERVLGNVHEILDSTLNLLRGRLARIRVHRDYGELPELESLAGQLGQVFMNLLSNAADALGDSGTLTVRTRALEGGRVAIEIEDDGKGIEPEHLERIFDPFFTTKDVGKGTGLGLSVSWGIVERHGGTIRVRSEPGRGSCFRVELPLRMPEPPGA